MIKSLISTTGYRKIYKWKQKDIFSQIERNSKGKGKDFSLLIFLFVIFFGNVIFYKFIFFIRF